MYKILSIIFDYAIAYAIAYFLCKIQNKKKYRAYFNVIYAIVLFLPTVVLNSAYWGQCDSIYSFFVVLTLLYVYQEKYTRAFIYYGIAFGFKLQAIFILPFLICIYIKNKKFSIYQFGITLLVFWAMGIAGFIYGRGFLEPFQIYMKQSDTYKGMYLNCASFYRLLGSNYTMLKGFAMSFIVFLFGIALYVILVGKKRMVTGEQFLNTVTWFVWTCLFFLPAMHERYTYLLDLLLIMLVAINRSYLKYAFLSFTISLMTYGSYLYGNVKITHTSSFLLFAAWIYYTVEIIKKDVEQKEIEVVE